MSIIPKGMSPRPEQPTTPDEYGAKRVRENALLALENELSNPPHTRDAPGEISTLDRVRMLIRQLTWRELQEMSGAIDAQKAADVAACLDKWAHGEA